MCLDEDLIILHSDKSHKPYEIKNSKLHHSCDYTSYDGIVLKDWLGYKVIQGKIV
ncbi:hypothetical protein EDD18DRAFT_1358017 [Armillaria luteobubalina]|uniref:Uncharacterized protein n=1 Tax=Armillaria luteobubalina TaxID=153913 RepID=A0AA39Q066_9AGAR|nr:hypothetical protein EDD18DRAFT_1358017 [Armillaria luteobubalina]